MLVALAADAAATWTTVEMGPDHVHGGYAGRQVGEWRPATVGPVQPAIWSGTAGSYQNLTPTGYLGGIANAIDVSHTVGYVFNSGLSREASLWNSTVWSSLHPNGALESTATDVHAGRQVGNAEFAINVPHAAVWTGTAASFLDLNPTGASSSTINSTWNGIHGGQTVMAGVGRAGVWTSDSASAWVDLHPSGSANSAILQVGSSHRVGWAVFGSTTHAYAWDTLGNGTDLHEAGTTRSMAKGTWTNLHVGFSEFSGSIWKARLWSGGTAIDLHQYLPGGYTQSVAEAIWEFGGDLYIGGSAFHPTLGNRATLWVQPVPEPGCLAITLLGLAAMRRAKRGRFKRADQVLP